MKLSTAIRIGSMTTKQIKSSLTDGGNGRCALGAALEAINKCYFMPTMTDVVSNFPIVVKFAYPPTQFIQTFTKGRVNSEELPIMDIVWMLNDSVGWTRDQIADWIEEQENLLEQQEAQREKQVEAKEFVEAK